jgi:hypothetical protein
MKSLRHINLELSGVEIVLPALVAIEGQASDQPLKLIMGFAERYCEGMVPGLVGQWLAQLFHRTFVEHGRGINGDLAAEAFYDKLAHDFHDEAPFVASIALCKDDVGHTLFETSPFARATLQPGKGRNAGEHGALMRFVGGTELARWRICGRVRAYLNPRIGTAQVTFDDLPGGIKLISTSRLPASAARAMDHARQVAAWYGFGVPIRKPADAVMELRNEIAAFRRRVNTRETAPI